MKLVVELNLDAQGGMLYNTTNMKRILKDIINQTLSEIPSGENVVEVVRTNTPDWERGDDKAWVITSCQAQLGMGKEPLAQILITTTSFELVENAKNDDKYHTTTHATDLVL